MNFPLFIFFLCFILTFILKIPICLGMLMSSIYYFVLAPGPAKGVQMVALQFLSQMNIKFIFIAVPLFIFAAKVMNTGEITNMVFKVSNVLVGRWKGGLGHVNVVCSLIFSGMTGSALADASGIGILEIEAMRKSGYDDSFSCAITATSATIGPIFPPSLPMITYALFSGASVGKLFMGGIIPGILIAIALMIYIYYIANKRNYPRGEVYSYKEFVRIIIKAFPALLTPAILMGTIYGGFVTATEAAAIAGLYAFIVSSFIYRSFGLKQLLSVIIDTVRTTGTVAIVVGSAYIFSYIMALEHIPDMVYQLASGLTNNKYVMLLIINIVFLILGMFLDTSAIHVIFVPIFLPLIKALGIDLVHFGVMIVLNMMIGLSTPPFGILLFIVSGISGTPLKDVIREVYPMLLVLIIVLFMVTYIPDLVLFIPRSAGW